MIGKLTGTVDAIYDSFLILSVGGIGFRVFCSNRTLSLAGVKQNLSMWIETQVREDHIHLFGFADNAEKECFLLLTNVQGVGAKVGLAILSALSPSEVSIAIATQDAKAFTKALGVGPKLAARIVSELKGKNTGFGDSISMSVVSSSPANNGVVEEAISALTNLGYARSDAGVVVGRVFSQNENLNISDLIRLSLKEIGKNNG